MFQNKGKHVFSQFLKAIICPGSLPSVQYVEWCGLFSVYSAIMLNFHIKHGGGGVIAVMTASRGFYGKLFGNSHIL